MKILKKHKYKLLTLMLSIVSIFTLFLGINKTYAYETDTFSYTMSIYTNNNCTTENTPIDYQTSTILLEDVLPYNNGSYLYFTLNEGSGINLNSYYLLVNFYYVDSGNRFTYSTSSMIFTLYTNNQTYSFSYVPRNSKSINNMFTAIMQVNTSNIYFYNNCRFLISCDSGYTMLIKNIDIVNSNKIGIDNYYETYYGQIEDNYNALLSDYNDLQSDYDTLNTQYLNLQQEVTDLTRQINALRQSYNNLQEEYNQLKNNIDNVYNSGSFYYVDNVESYLSDDTNYTYRYGKYKEYTLTELVKDLYIVSGKLNITKLDNNILVTGETGDYFNNNYPYYLGLNFKFINNIPVKNVDFQFQDFLSNSIELNQFIVTNGNNEYTISLSNNIDHITYEVLQNNSNVDLTNYYLKSWNITTRATYSGDYPYIVSNYSIDSLTYNEGYYDGYNTINRTKDDQITQLEIEINDLESEINDLNAIVQSRNQVIQGLREQIASIDDDYNLNNLMWTIASTPFESFKHIWNVDFLGVNIAQMITGLITAFIILYIVKKFF